MSSQSRHSQTRHRAIAARGAVLAACGLLVAACGSVAAGHSASNQAGGQPATHGPSAPLSAQPSTGTNGSASPSSGPARVKVSISLGGSKHWSLQCQPASGNVPDPQNACRRLLAQPSFFAPSPHHVMCPQIMTDAPSFVVTGTVKGVRVHETIVAGSCDLAKWNTLNAIVLSGLHGVNPGGPAVN